MKKTTLTTILAVVLVVALALAITACGDSKETATTAAAATPTTAAATATTAGTSDTLPSLEMTEEVQKYMTDMSAAMGALQTVSEDTNPFKMDPATVTDAQIDSANKSLAEIQKAYDALKGIKAPDALKTLHEKLVGGIAMEIELAKKAIKALKDKDQGALDAAKAESDKLDQEMNDFFDSLGTMLGGGTPAS